MDRINDVIYAGQCEYRDTPVGRDVLDSLKDKCRRIGPFEKYKVVHCLFSVSGYTDDVIADTATDGSMLFDRGELLH